MLRITKGLIGGLHDYHSRSGQNILVSQNLDILEYRDSRSGTVKFLTVT